MALAKHAVQLLAPYLKNAKILGLAYPDIICTPQEVEEIFGVRPLKHLADAGEQHGIDWPVVETGELLRLLGSTLDCIDVVRWRGFERIADLNILQDFGQYDLVIDPGTSEHCFNVGTAIMNGARAVKPGGRIYHSLPLSMLNHGFYNLCPTALWDFYRQNGWELELYEARHATKSEMAVPVVPIRTAEAAHKRSAKVAPECGLICLARRQTDAPLKWPMQGKYLAMQKKPVP